MNYLLFFLPKSQILCLNILIASLLGGLFIIHTYILRKHLTMTENEKLVVVYTGRLSTGMHGL